MSEPSGNNPPRPRDNRGGRNRNRNRSPRPDGDRPRPEGERRQPGPDRGPRRDDRGPRRKDRGPRNQDRRGGRDSRPPRPESRAKPPAKSSFGQKLLTILTFGLYRPKSGAKKPGPKPAPGSAQRPPREPRAPAATLPPVDIESIDTDRLHVGNLSYDATESDLNDLFNGIGKVKYADIVYNGRTHRSKGFGFVQMMSVIDARRAVEELHGKPFMGRPLQLGPARSRGGDEREADDDQEPQA